MQHVVSLQGVATSICVVLSGAEDRAFVSCNSGNGAITPAALTEDALQDCTHLHIGGYFNCAQLQCGELVQRLQQCKQRGVSISIDTQFDVSDKWGTQDGIFQQILALADVFLPNELEVQRVVGASSVEDAMQVLTRSHPQPWLTASLCFL